MKRLYILPFLLFANTLSAQELCEDPLESPIKDLNGINKCAVVSKSSDSDQKEISSTRGLTLKQNSNFKSRFLTIRRKAAAPSVVRSVKARGVQAKVNSVINEQIKQEVTTAALQLEDATINKKLHERKIEDIRNVDRVPLFKACKKLTIDELQRKCFNQEMSSYINNNINYPEEIEEGRLAVKFVIDADGKVNNIKTSGSEGMKALKEAIIDSMSSLPDFYPAQKDNVEVPVEYEFLLNFSE